MNREKFIYVLQGMHQQEVQLHLEKGEQYSSENNTFDNFIQGAKAMDQTPREYCLTLAEKHRQALLRNARGESQESVAMIKERVRDIRLYMALYYGLTLDDIVG